MRRGRRYRWHLGLKRPLRSWYFGPQVRRERMHRGVVKRTPRAYQGFSLARSSRALRIAACAAVLASLLSLSIIGASWLFSGTQASQGSDVLGQESTKAEAETFASEVYKHPQLEGEFISLNLQELQAQLGDSCFSLVSNAVHVDGSSRSDEVLEAAFVIETPLGSLYRFHFNRDLAASASSLLRAARGSYQLHFADYLDLRQRVWGCILQEGKSPHVYGFYLQEKDDLQDEGCEVNILVYSQPQNY